jgi:phenylacetate-CoA ligase
VTQSTTTEVAAAAAPGDRPWRTAEVEDPASRLERLHADLGAQLHRARSTRFYGALLEGSGADAGVVLADLPRITKGDIIAAQQQAPPYGGLLAVEPQRLARVHLSGGPEATFFTASDLEVVADDGAWAFCTNGFRADDLVDVTIGYHWVIAGTAMDASFRRLGCAVVPGGAGGPAVHLENIRWAGVTGLFAFPTFLDELTATADAAGIDVASLGVRLASIAGEMQTPGQRAVVEQRWGMQIREMYGCAEVPFVAAQCPSSEQMHVNPDVLVEVLDPATWSAVEPGTPGVVVLTDVRREAMQVVRYVTGDITSGLFDGPCTCGRTTPRLGRILGRASDVPRVKGMFVVPSQVRRALDEFDGLGRFQLRIDRPGTQDTLAVVVVHEGPEGDRPALTERVVQRLRDTIRLTCEVSLVAADRLGPDEPVVVDRRVTT